MSRLQNPLELQEGKKYKIHEGFGKGTVGVCKEITDSPFGHRWGLIVPDGPGEAEKVRWQMLEAMEQLDPIIKQWEPLDSEADPLSHMNVFKR